MSTHYVVWFWLWAGVLKLAGVPPENYYNQGNRWYQAGQFAQAEQAYARACGEPRLRYAAFFNAGNAAYRRGDYGRALLDYEGALDAKPEDEDAWHNLELARQRAASANAGTRADAAAPPREHSLALLPPPSAARVLSGSAGSGADQALSQIRAQEHRLSGYFSPRREEINTGATGRDIFDLPPDQLAAYIRRETLAGYPFKPGSSLQENQEKQSDEVDW
jgi:tetratricopeptide (TPR) repeat protein